MMDERDRSDSKHSTDSAEPTESTDPNEPIDPTDNAEPTDPIDRTEFLDPMLNSELSDHSDQRLDPVIIQFYLVTRLDAQPGPTQTRGLHCPHQRVRCPGTAGSGHSGGEEVRR